MKRFAIYMHSDDIQFLRECPDGDYCKVVDVDATILELRAQVEMMQERIDSLVQATKDFDDYHLIVIERDALARDAARYRWLRNDCDYLDERYIRNGDELKCGEDLDRAIDEQLNFGEAASGR